MYLDEKITKWWKEDINSNSTLKHQQLLTLLFAYDQVIILNTEGDLQKAAY
jgi:hypothetical protein